MKQQYTPVHQETLFNAGVDTALQISRLAKQAGYYSTTGDYSNMYNQLESLEIWMHPKFKTKDEAMKELEGIKEKHIANYRRYCHRLSKGNIIPPHTLEGVKAFMNEWFKCLMFWRDKFGYGMPLKDDSRYVLG